GHRWLLAGAMLALIVPVRAAEIDKYLPGDAEVVATVNVKQIADSAVFKKYGEEKARELLKDNDHASKVLEALGLDPFKHITSVTIAAAGTDDKGYIIVHGQFDIAKF